MAWDALTSAMTDADSPVNQTLMDAIRNRLDWLLSDSDSWNTSGIAQGTGLAASGVTGLLSGSTWGSLMGVATGNFSGNNTTNRTITTGLSDCKLVILFDTANSKVFFATENSAQGSYNGGVFTASTLDLIISGADFAVGNRNPGPPLGPNNTGSTSYWIAFGAL